MSAQCTVRPTPDPNQAKHKILTLRLNGPMPTGPAAGSPCGTKFKFLKKNFTSIYPGQQRRYNDFIREGTFRVINSGSGIS